MIINETHIRKIVAESLRYVLSELSVGVIGRSGPIKGSDMFAPRKRFAKEYALVQEIFKKNQENHHYRVKLEKAFAGTEAFRAYQQYYNAMMSKEGKQAVGFITWLKFLCEGKDGQPIMGYEVDGSYLFGLWIDGFFLCAYFAPNGFKGMFKVVGGIAQYNNIIFAVTQDMSSMLERLGIPKADKTHDAPWRDQIVTKDVFGTSEEAIEKGFEILDMGVEMGKMKNQVRKFQKDNNEDEMVKGLISQYKQMDKDKQEKFRGKVLDMLKKKRPDILGKIDKNGVRI